MGVPLIVYECRWIWILKYKKYESTSVEAFFGTAYRLPVGLSRWNVDPQKIEVLVECYSKKKNGHADLLW